MTAAARVCSFLSCRASGSCKTTPGICRRVSCDSRVGAGELELSLKPTLAAFLVMMFETKTNQNLGRNRKYQVFKTGHGDRLGDERRSAGPTPCMLHDPSFLLEDRRRLHLASGLS